MTKIRTEGGEADGEAGWEADGETGGLKPVGPTLVTRTEQCVLRSV